MSAVEIGPWATPPTREGWFRWSMGILTHRSATGGYFGFGLTRLTRRGAERAALRRLERIAQERRERR